ncbi:kinesin-like protein Cin8p [Monosporozyma servazzii]
MNQAEHDPLSSQDSMNITVAVRCRGRNKREIDAKSPVIVTVPDSTTNNYPNEVSINTTDDIGITAKLNSKTYKVDKVLSPNISQEALFNDIVTPLFNDFIKGYNCTILVYGMTSTGKTYTMTGDESNDFLLKDKRQQYDHGNIKLNESAGIIPRILCKLFDTLEYEKNIASTSNYNNSNNNMTKKSDNTTDNLNGTDYVVKCSFLELYNEELKDLLYDTNDNSNSNHNSNNNNNNTIPPSKKLRIFDGNSINHSTIIKTSTIPTNDTTADLTKKRNGSSRIRKSISNRNSLPASLESGNISNNNTRKQSLNNNNNTNNNQTTEIYIQNLKEFHINNAKDGLLLLQNGLKQRQMASTKMNDFSSRSHTIFTITLYKKFKDQMFRLSKLNLVDLAGSENISKSGAINLRAKEAGSINQSLLTLGRVINSLSESTNNHNKKNNPSNNPSNNNNNSNSNNNDISNTSTNHTSVNDLSSSAKNNKARNIHIPFRESKLTRLLQDSLGGNTKTILIATISPAKLVSEETCSTLEYASKAKNIQNKPQLGSFILKDILLKDITQELIKLRADLWSTKSKDGIYMSQENYKNLMNEIETNKIDLKELKQNNITLERSNAILLDENKRVNELLQKQNNKNSILNEQLLQYKKQADKKEIQLSDLTNVNESLNKNFNQLTQNFEKMKQNEIELRSNVESLLTVEFNRLRNGFLGQLKKKRLLDEQATNGKNVNESIELIKTQFIQLLQETRDKAMMLYNSCVNDLLKETPVIFNQISDNITNIKTMTTTYYTDMAEKLSDLSEENSKFKHFLDSQFALKNKIVNGKTTLDNELVNQYVQTTLGDMEHSSSTLIQSLLSMITEHFNQNKNLLTSTVDNVTRNIIDSDNKQWKPYFNKWQGSIELINQSDSINNKYWNQLNTQVDQVTDIINNSRNSMDNSIKTIQDQNIGINENMDVEEKIRGDRIINENFQVIDNNISSLSQTLQDEFHFKKNSLETIQSMDKRIKSIINKEVENAESNDNKNSSSSNILIKKKSELQFDVPLRPTSLSNVNHVSSIPRSRSASPKKRSFNRENSEEDGTYSSKIPRLSQ